MDLSAAETPLLLAAAGAADMLRSDGVLHLYESEAELDAAQPGWQARAEHGIAFTHLHGPPAIAELQPGLSPALVAATFVPGWKTVSDPLQVTEALARQLRATGRPHPARATRTALAPGARWRQRACCAMGSRSTRATWSSPPARGRIVSRARSASAFPLETERGYNTTLPVGAFDLKRQLTFGGHGFVVTPLACGVRVGGAVEFAGLDAPPNFARAAALLAKAKRFMPGLRTEGGQRVDGISPVVARHACPRSGRRATDERVDLCVRPRPPRPHAGRRDGAPRRRPHVRAAGRRSISRPFVRSGSVPRDRNREKPAKRPMTPPRWENDKEEP